MKKTKRKDEFELYDLRVEVISTDKPFVCSHKEGNYFKVIGGNLVFKKSRSFDLYALSIGLRPQILRSPPRLE